MTEAEKAYAAAERLIEAAKLQGTSSLIFDQHRFRHLRSLPPAIAELDGLIGLGLAGIGVTDLRPLGRLTKLSWLDLSSTRVHDLSPIRDLRALTDLMLRDTKVNNLLPLSDMNELKFLDLDNTPALDLRPLRSLKGLSIGQAANERRRLWYGLSFNDTAATRIDPRIAEISEIKNPAERARTLFAYLEDWEPPASPLRNPLPPVVPAQRPAPIVAEFDAAGVLVEAPYDSPLAGGAETRARAGWQALREIYDDVAEALSRPNLPNLSRAIAAFGRALGESYETMRPIALGTHGQRIVAISRTSATALLDDAEGELLAFAAAIELHLRRFPDWVEYLRDDAAQSEGPALQEALPQLREISAAFHEIEAIAPALARKFDDLVEAAEDADLPQALARAGVLSSLSNILSAIAGRALAAGRSGSKKYFNAILDTAMKGAATLTLAGVRVGLHWLAQQYPSYLGWVPAVLRWLGLG